jgi:hypothetical protein
MGGLLLCRLRLERKYHRLCHLRTLSPSLSCPPFRDRHENKQTKLRPSPPNCPGACLITRLPRAAVCDRSFHCQLSGEADGSRTRKRQGCPLLCRGSTPEGRSALHTLRTDSVNWPSQPSFRAYTLGRTGRRSTARGSWRHKRRKPGPRSVRAVPSGLPSLGKGHR